LITKELAWLKHVSNDGYHHRGEGHEQVAKAEAALDTAFIDADKGGYVHHLNKLLLLVRPGGLILAHNVDMVSDYVSAVRNHLLHGWRLYCDFEETLRILDL
jgi:predicted O-methyltransferase YrrM